MYPLREKNSHMYSHGHIYLNKEKATILCRCLCIWFFLSFWNIRDLFTLIGCMKGIWRLLYLHTEISLLILSQRKNTYNLQTAKKKKKTCNWKHFWTYLKICSKHLITSGNRRQCGCSVYRLQNKGVPYLPRLTRVKVK